MALSRGLVVVVCLAGPVAVPPLVAQKTTATVVGDTPIPPSHHAFAHHKSLRASYDSTVDSTRLAVVTHNGRYFLTVERPRLTWSVSFPGRLPTTEAPAVVELEFRTQEPQAAADSRLVITALGGKSFEVESSAGWSVPGTNTWSHFMRFPVETDRLVAALGGDTLTVTVGGLRERFKRDQLEALRDLLDRVGAWPTVAFRRPGA